MLGRLIAEQLFGDAVGSAVDETLEEFSGRPGRCPHCAADAVSGRLGPLTFLPFFLGFAAMVLGTVPAVAGLAGLASGDGEFEQNQYLVAVGIGVGTILGGVVLVRMARWLAHRSRFFAVKCRSCGHRWRQPMPPGEVSLEGTVGFAYAVWVLLCLALLVYVVVSDWDQFKSEIDALFSSAAWFGSCIGNPRVELRSSARSRLTASGAARGWRSAGWGCGLQERWGSETDGLRPGPE